jgi:hypothetical protein
MDMTPRQLEGCLFFHERDEQRRRAADLSINAMAARGEPRALKKQLREMTRD